MKEEEKKERKHWHREKGLLWCWCPHRGEPQRWIVGTDCTVCGWSKEKKNEKG